LKSTILLSLFVNLDASLCFCIQTCNEAFRKVSLDFGLVVQEIFFKSKKVGCLILMDLLHFYRGSLKEASREVSFNFTRVVSEEVFCKQMLTCSGELKIHK